MSIQDELKTDYDIYAENGEEKEILRAEKKAAREVRREEKRRAKELRRAEKLGFTADMLGDDFGKDESIDDIISNIDSKNKEAEKTDSVEKVGKVDDASSSEEGGSTVIKEDDKNTDHATDSKSSQDADSENKTEAADSHEASYEESEDNKKNRKKRKERPRRDPHFNVVRELLSIIIYMGTVILICFVITTFVGNKVVVSGDSMKETLHDEDSLWVDKLSYRFSDPQRFDIIVFPYRPGGDILFIKRIIGLPGENVRIVDGKILINGEVLKEDYGLDIIIDPGIAGGESGVTLAHDEYFVLGDNRNNSNDSRKSNVGNVKRENIIGKAVFRITPFDDAGKLE